MLYAGEMIRAIVVKEAEQAIAERGHFALAIPGGSILKMLAGDIANKGNWTSKTTLVYVNHKCVSMDDGDLATHAKARTLFLDNWDGVNAIVLGGSADGEKEAKDYEDQMRALSDEELPKSVDGFPLFDLSLIGVGGTYICFLLTDTNYYINSILINAFLNQI
jgi:6-phosphogluconolactonase